jgi:membrane-associated protease RseP (regulator of RpoE activity)
MPRTIMSTCDSASAQRGTRARRVAIALSVALHAALLAAFALQRGDDEAAAAHARGVLVRLVLAPGTLVPAPDSDGPLGPRAPSVGSRVLPIGCRGEVYTGIGARVNQAGFIIDLAPDGPAERAGVRPGDAILNIQELPIDFYPVGQPVALRLLRDGAEVRTIVRIGAICNEPPASVA